MNLKGKAEKKKRKVLIGKNDMTKLLDLIAGGKKCLTVERVKEYLEVIMLSVRAMRSYYRKYTNKSYLDYYGPYWTKIEAAFEVENDDELVSALEGLRGAIENW